MVDIQSATAENRRGKRRKKEEETTAAKCSVRTAAIKMHILSPITQNFLLVGPYFLRVFFSATMDSTYSTYRFGGCGLRKLFGD